MPQAKKNSSSLGGIKNANQTSMRDWTRGGEKKAGRSTESQLKSESVVITQQKTNYKVSQHKGLAYTRDLLCAINFY